MKVSEFWAEVRERMKAQPRGYQARLAKELDVEPSYLTRFLQGKHELAPKYHQAVLDSIKHEIDLKPKGGHRMSLSEAQTRILRDMASGAELFRGITGKYNLRRYVGYDLIAYTVPRRTFDCLFDAGFIARKGLVDGHMAGYALTPAGAAAAGEGME